MVDTKHDEKVHKEFTEKTEEEIDEILARILKRHALVYERLAEI